MTRILSVASKGLGYLEKSKPMNWLENKYNKNPEKVLGLMAVGSIVIKDGIGCYKYVTQSLKNDKIPEEKRKFVAALDLTNGVLMIAAQIGMFFAMRKFSEPIFNKLFKNSFNDKNAKNIASKIRMHQEQAGEVVARKLKIEKEYNSVRKDALDLFKFVADIGAATIIGKRIIVPFIATPLADKVKKKMDAHDNPKTEASKESNDTKPASETTEKPVTGQNLNIVNVDTNLLHQYRHALGYKHN